jgi:hypothetical protein
MHAFWSERARNTDLPIWLRLAALAYSSHTKNGHATFMLALESTLPEVLGMTNKHPLQQIRNEIRRAIRHGFLAEESNHLCLVLPDGITGGAEGHRHSPRHLHKKKR